MNKFDIIVFGGGTAGCAAAYIAGKLGLKVLLLEKNSFLGGTMTSGLVIPAMKSSDNQINTEFYNDLISEMSSLGGQITYQNNPGWFNPELLKIALDNLMLKANVEVRFNISINEIIHKNKLVTGIALCTNILSGYNYTIYTDNTDNTIQSDNLLSEYIDTRYAVDATGNAEIFQILNCNFLENKNETQPFSLRFIMGGIDLNKFGKWLLDVDSDRNVTTVEDIGGNIHLSTAYTWDSNKEWALRPLFEDAIANDILKESDSNYFQVFTIPGMPDSLAFNCPRIVDTDGTVTAKNMSKALSEGRQAILRLVKFCKTYFPGFDNSYLSNIADSLGIRTSHRIKGKYVYTMQDIVSGKIFQPLLQ